MPSFVDPWDVTEPTGTKLRSAGDDRIRELKRALKERYEIEHDFPTATGTGSGRHKFGYGDTTARDAIPTAERADGMIWFDTDTDIIHQWDAGGAVWRERGVNISLSATDTTERTLTTSATAVAPITIITAGIYLLNWRLAFTVDDNSNRNGPIVHLGLNGSEDILLYSHRSSAITGVTLERTNSGAIVKTLAASDAITLRLKKFASSGTIKAINNVTSALFYAIRMSD